MRICLPLIFSALFFSCKPSVPATVTDYDTVKTDTSHNLLPAEVRDRNNFRSPIGNPFFDRLMLRISQSKSLRITEILNRCSGDYCQSYQLFADTISKEEYYFFKGENNNGGYDNNQFYLKDGTILYTRNFSVAPEDTQHWLVHETTYDFDQVPMTKTIRKKVVNSPMDIDLSKTSFQIGNANLPKDKNDLQEELKGRINFGDLSEDKY